MSDFLQPFFSLGVSEFLWLGACVMLPREYMRKSMVEHYRSWVRDRAYWNRAYYKWIIGERVFYTDDFWGDIFTSLLFGIPPSGVFFALAGNLGFLPGSPSEGEFMFAVAGILALPPVLFAARIFDRCRVAGEEILRLSIADPTFSSKAEIAKLLVERKYVTCVLGHGASIGRNNKS